MGVAIPISRATSTADANRRLRRLRALAWFLDRSIPIGPWRVGVDPIIGLLPGVGDWIGAVLGLYLLYQGARLGLSANVLARMGGNILVETIVGAIPVLGDLFDFAWQANSRNLALVEKYYRPALKPRSFRNIGLAIGTIALLVFALLAAAIFGLIHFLSIITR